MKKFDRRSVSVPNDNNISERCILKKKKKKTLIYLSFRLRKVFTFFA